MIRLWACCHVLPVDETARVCMLFAAGSDVDAREPDAGRTALHLAVAHRGGSLPLFEAVLRRSPQLDALDSGGCAALHLAIDAAARAKDASVYIQMGRALLSGETRRGEQMGGNA